MHSIPEYATCLKESLSHYEMFFGNKFGKYRKKGEK